MIILSKPHCVQAFNTYDTLYSHLESLEKNSKKGKWIFARHSWQRLLSYCRYVHSPKYHPEHFLETFERGLEKALQQATGEMMEKEQDERPDVLEIITGRKPVFIPITPDVDVAALRKKWCETYCKSHGYGLFRISHPLDFERLQYSGGENDSVIG